MVPILTKLTLALLSLVAAPLGGGPLVVHAASAEEWKSRNVYQVLTDRFMPTDAKKCAKNPRSYCGGTFKGLLDNLDHMQRLGFDAVWISPIVKNSPGGYHGYWTTDFYGVNEHFGTADDLKALSMGLKKRGMLLMLDVVVNHASPDVKHDLSNLEQVGVFPFSKYTSLSALNISQKTQYHSSHISQKTKYHPYCRIEWGKAHNEEELENCWLSSLPDFKQEDPETAAELLTWVDFIVKEYEIDGLRMDTCLHVPKWFLKQVNEKAGVYMVCEANSGNVMVNAPFQEAGIDATLNIPFLWGVRNVLLHDHGFNALRDIWTKGVSAYKDQFRLGNCFENHDNPRFLYECAQAEEGKANPIPEQGYITVPQHTGCTPATGITPTIFQKAPCTQKDQCVAQAKKECDSRPDCVGFSFFAGWGIQVYGAAAFVCGENGQPNSSWTMYKKDDPHNDPHKPADKDPSEICMARFRNAIVAQFMWPGIPITYYGAEFGFRGGHHESNREPLTVDMQKDDPQGLRLQRLFKVMAATRSAEVAAGGFKDMFLSPSKDAWCWGRETGGESDVLTCITHAKTTKEFKVPVQGKMFKGYHGKVCNVVRIGEQLCTSEEDCCQELGEEISVVMKQGEAVVFLTEARAKEVIQKAGGDNFIKAAVSEGGEQKTAAFMKLSRRSLGRLWGGLGRLVAKFGEVFMNLFSWLGGR